MAPGKVLSPERARNADTPPRDACHPRWLGLARGTGRQRGPSGEHADLRSHLGDVSACAAPHLRQRCGPASRTDGQLGSRASQHRRGTRGDAGTAAHRSCDRKWRAGEEPGARRLHRNAEADRRHLSPDGARVARRRAFAPEPRRRARGDSQQCRHPGCLPRLHGRTRHAAPRGCGIHGAPCCRPAACGPRRDRHRPLLRDGSRQPLGARVESLRGRRRRQGRGLRRSGGRDRRRVQTRT